MAVWDGFIDQYMLDEFGEDYVGGPIPGKENANIMADFAQNVLNQTPMGESSREIEIGPRASGIEFDAPIQEQVPTGLMGQTWGTGTPGYSHGNLPAPPRKPGIIENVILKGVPQKIYESELEQYNKVVNQAKRQQLIQNMDWSDPTAVAKAFISGAPTEEGRKFGFELFKQQMKPESAQLPAAVQQYKFAQDQGYKGSFVDYQKDLKKAGATNISMGGKEFVSPSEANNLRYLDGSEVLPFTPKSEIAGKVKAVSAQGAKDLTQAQKSQTIVDEMDVMLFGDNGIYKDYESDSFADKAKFTIKSNVQQYAQTDPRYKNYTNYAQGTLAPLAKSLGQAGSLSDTDLQLVMGLIPVISGANPDSPEVAREKINKLNRIIKSGTDQGEITKDMIYEVVGKPKSKTVAFPEVGEVRNGYIYIGGNPNDKYSWRKE